MELNGIEGIIGELGSQWQRWESKVRTISRVCMGFNGVTTSLNHMKVVRPYVSHAVTFMAVPGSPGGPRGPGSPKGPRGPGGP
jgi:hypothetical protein